MVIPGGGIRANPGPVGMEVATGQDPVGQALRKLRTLGINTSAVTLSKSTQQAELNTIKKTRSTSASASRGRKNSV